MAAIVSEGTKRWATIKTFAKHDDLQGEREEVFKTESREARHGPPTLSPDLERTNNLNAYRVEEVDYGVKAGMIRGGQYEAVGEWGWRDHETMIRNGGGIVPKGGPVGLRQRKPKGQRYGDDPQQAAPMREREAYHPWPVGNEKRSFLER